MNTPKVNIKVIAQKAGVSPATISRAMNPETRGKVARATLMRIEKLVQEYAYTPNFAAKSLRKLATKTIGLVFPYLPGIYYSPYYQHILSGISDYLKETDYQFKLLLLKGDNPKWNQYDFRAGERVDALIITHWFMFFSDKSIFENLEIPSVIINDIESDVSARFFGVDHFIGGQIAAHHLCSLGHRRIAILTGPSWSKDSQQRVLGFQTYLRKNGTEVPADLILSGDFLETKAYAQMDVFLRKASDLTAIFCCNDQMAYGAIRRIKELGLYCPKDISIIGYDDDPLSTSFNPPLTTIHVPIYKIAQEASQYLVNCLKGDSLEKFTPGSSLFPVHLVERQSVQKVNF